MSPRCTEGPQKWMGVKSWCVMKITLSGAKYILQMTERVLQLQPRWWGWWDGEHGLGGLISGDTSGPLLHKINMTLFCLFWRGFYPFWEVFFTRLSVSSWAWAAFTYGFCCNVFRGAIPLLSCSDRYEGVTSANCAGHLYQPRHNQWDLFGAPCGQLAAS